MNILFFCLSLVTSLTFAQDFTLDKESGKAVPNYVGQLKLLKGEAFKSVNGELEDIKVGDRFYKGDILVTAKKSFAKILIVDDSIVSLGPESEMEIKDFKFKDKTDRQFIFSLVKGKLSGEVRNKAKSGEIQFKTKYATMGVRGTVVLLNHRKLSNIEVSEFALLSGAAAITGEGLSAEELAPGQRIVLIRNNSKNIQAHQKLSMPEPLWNELKAEKMNGEKEFKPFLPFFEISEVAPDSSLSPVLETTPSSVPEKSKSSEAPEEKKKNWRESLKKLNDQLKNNQ